jgi:hypothetical protein
MSRAQSRYIPHGCQENRGNAERAEVLAAENASLRSKLADRDEALEMMRKSTSHLETRSD